MDSNEIKNQQIQDNVTLNVDDIRKLLKFFSKGYKVSDLIYKTLNEIAIREIEEKHRVVMIKRDPNINRDRIAGALVKITDGATIRLANPMVQGLGADFDGDKIAIYTPMSKESQAEVKTKMISAVQNESINAPSFAVSKEMLVGLYTLTYLEKSGDYKKISSVKEAESMDIGKKVIFNVRGKDIKTTAGRVIFNSFLPKYIDFINEPMDSKKIRKLLSSIINKSHKDYADTVNHFSQKGFIYSTMYPQTLSLDMFDISDNIKKLREDLKKEKDVGQQVKIVDEMNAQLLEYLKTNVPELYIQVKSGAAKDIGQLRQMMVSKGLIYDANGKLLPPITSCLGDGYDSETYFEASAGSRKGIADRAINTAAGGYAYRKMVYCLGNVEANINNADCGTKKYFKIKLTPDLFSRMKGRYVGDPKTHKIYPIQESMIGSVINLRSPVYCKSKDICRTCYGDLLYQTQSRNVGIIAATQCFSLSENIMKCSVGMIETENGLESMEDVWENS